jgi:hypothetical protein
MYRQILTILVLMLLSHACWAKSDYIDSALSAIDSANGQGG